MTILANAIAQQVVAGAMGWASVIIIMVTLAALVFFTSIGPSVVAEQ